MPIRLQPGFFDIHERTGKLTEMGDPLVGLKEQIDWEAFRPSLNVVYEKARKSNTGAKPIDVVLMFKILGIRPGGCLSSVLKKVIMKRFHLLGRMC